MLQGTGSDVGKSLLVTGLARAYVRRGLAVRPFKPQNMSNNAAVTLDGGEIGRAQALQARASGVAPSADMNPVLLKPESETGVQVVVQGRIAANAGAGDYHALKPSLMPSVLESFGRLADGADVIICEGAGSPAEINLRPADIANMGFAEAADVPVLLVADIARGGVIANLVGTHALLTAPERARIKGFIINKFRGDVSLFEPALQEIEDRTGWPALGIVPHFDGARTLPAEDAMALEGDRYRRGGGAARREGAITIAVPRTPRISNFDDLDPLAAEPGVILDVVEAPRPIPLDADAVLLLGSKSTLGDLDYLRSQGWDTDIRALARRGAVIIGLCGGYQMLGRSIHDKQGIEGKPGTMAGLGLLDVVTELAADKTLIEVKGLDVASGAEVSGYEMHLGQTTGADCARPMIEIAGQGHGARAASGRVMGCYLHGIFAADNFRRAFVGTLGGIPDEDAQPFEARIEDTLDGLAEHLEAHMNLDRVLEIARGR
ncbi:MAG: cobyric acid synthase [Alphaproteobacteria bacterium]